MFAHHIRLYLLANDRTHTKAQSTSPKVEHELGMSTTPPSTEDHHEPGHYEIRIMGHLDDRWADWFEGMTITLESNGETRLTGAVIDQSTLHGLLKKVRDLGMPLVSVNRIEPGSPDTKP